jgi:hypothetical protein
MLTREEPRRAGVLTSESYLLSPIRVVDETGRPCRSGRVVQVRAPVRTMAGVKDVWAAVAVQVDNLDEGALNVHLRLVSIPDFAQPLLRRGHACELRWEQGHR